MTLSAFTNAPGNHEKYGVERVTRSGSRYVWGQGLQPFTESWDTWPYLTDVSYKPHPVQGDHESPYSYGPREVYSIVKNEPGRDRDHYMPYPDGFQGYDYSTQFYLHERIRPFFFRDYHPYLDNCKKEAIVKALNSFYEGKTQLLADLATARQTCDMFASAASTGYKFLLNMKRGNFAAALGALGLQDGRLRGGSSLGTGTRAAANVWLQAQYGWKPLVQTIHDTQAIAFKEMTKDRKIIGRGSSRHSVDWESDDGDLKFKEKLAVSVKEVVYASLDSPTLSNLDALGLINPASVAWEIVPWSFAIDWFVPVGATLEAMSATAGLKFAKGWNTSHVDMSKQGEAVVRQLSPWSERINGGLYEERGFRFQREAHWAFPRPEFFADLTPFSTPRVLNALALSRQLFR